MRDRIRLLFIHSVSTATAVVMGLAVSGCAPSLQKRKDAAANALDALKESRFDYASESARSVLADDGENPFAAVIAAITLYKTTMHNLFLDGQTVVVGAAGTNHFNDRYFRSIVEEADRHLAEVARLLEVAAQEEAFSMELCLACLEVDWNQNGEVDDRDRVLLEVEQDAEERSIPKDDPRRRPVFRFDHGDVMWAQAFISFQRAALNLLSAWDLSPVAELLRSGDDRTYRFRLLHPERVELARTLILRGLSLSERTRQALLAETDDEREWLPNPRQKNHPLPLPVDDALYETWGLVVSDMEKLVRSEEGLSVSRIFHLMDEETGAAKVRGYLDIGRMLTAADDIVIRPELLEEDIEALEDGEPDEAEAALENIFGECYVKEMKPSGLPDRLHRMRSEVMTGKESFERKLRYLLWVN